MSFSLQDEKSEWLPSSSSTTWLSHSAALKSKNQDRDTSVQQRSQLV